MGIAAESHRWLVHATLSPGVLMTIDATSFRQAAGSFASSVTVVAVGAPEGFQTMTATAFCSLSMNPTLVLICLDKDSHTLSCLSKSSRFNIDILGADQEHLSRYFSSRGHDKSLDKTDYHLTESGLPVFERSAAHFECDCVTLLEEGDHVIVVGRVKDVVTRDEVEPLLYFRGGYRRLAPGQ